MTSRPKAIPPVVTSRWVIAPGAEKPAMSTVQVTLMQGDTHWSSEPKILMTVLGSCVVVCLWDKSRGNGGTNHFVLPNDRHAEKSTRYGDVAIDKLEAGLLRLGSRMGDLQAEVFGGPRFSRPREDRRLDPITFDSLWNGCATVASG
jgi:chemotaxis receptor (MCP) glutamine deamidase CheD